MASIIKSDLIWKSFHPSTTKDAKRETTPPFLSHSLLNKRKTKAYALRQSSWEINQEVRYQEVPTPPPPPPSLSCPGEKSPARRFLPLTFFQPQKRGEASSRMYRSRSAVVIAAERGFGSPLEVQIGSLYAPVCVARRMSLLSKTREMKMTSVKY